MAHYLSIDLETFSSVSIRDSGAWKYIQSPDFEILLFAYSLDGEPVQVIDLASGETVPEWLVNALTDPEYIKRAYNAPFEFGCLDRVYGGMIPSQWRCTMFHGLYCGYTAGLDATGKALGLPEDKQKLNTGKALIRYFCVPCKPSKSNGGRVRNLPKHDPAKWELFKEYNVQDVVTEMEIEKRLSLTPVPEWVQHQWEVDLTINQRGVAVDQELVQGALYMGAVTREALMQEATQITNLRNPNSGKQMLEWLNKAMETDDETSLTNLRKDTVSKMLDGMPEGDVKRVLEIRQELAKTSTKKYALSRLAFVRMTVYAVCCNSTVLTVLAAGLGDWCKCRICPGRTRKTSSLQDNLSGIKTRARYGLSTVLSRILFPSLSARHLLPVPEMC